MARLFYFDNSGNEQRLDLGLDAKPILIGRNPACNIVTENKSVSRMHAKFYVKDGAFVVEDLGSANGTYVGGERIAANTPVAIDLNAEYACGNFVLRLMADDAKPGTAVKAARPVEEPAAATPVAVPAAASPGAATGAPAAEAPRSASSRGDAIPARNATVMSAGVPRATGAAPGPAATPAHAAAQPHAAAQLHAAAPAQAAAPAHAAAQAAPPSHAGEPAQARGKAAGAEAKAAGGAPGGKAEGKAVATDALAAVPRAELEERTREAEAGVVTLERKLQELQTRTTGLTVQMEGLTKKYLEMRDQVQASEGLVASLRADVAERDARVGELEKRNAELDEQLAEARQKTDDDASRSADLKIKITQRDRELSELQRKVDILEYEVKEAHEESQSLRESHKTGDDSVDLLQTRINQLREVVEEKEQIVEELRYELKSRDEEIERVRIGAGIADLEDEKQRLLRDFYQKNREAEELKKQLDEARAQAGALDGQLQALGTIEAHPGYPALKARLDELEARASGLQADLARFTPEEKARLDKQVADLKAKNAELEGKLSESRDEKSALYGTAKKLDGIVEASLKTDDTLKQIEANVSMLKNYMGDVEKRAKSGGDAVEITILMKDLIKVMEGDVKGAQKSLARAIKS